MKHADLAVIGGGAAGFFAALRAAELHPEKKVIILEKSGKILSKVRISGGGRCNVTHACFDPAELVKNYPRGEKELLPVFHRFQPGDTLEWFSNRGVDIVAESDGRMFPATNTSQTIIDTFVSEANKSGIELLLNREVKTIEKNDAFTLTLADGSKIEAQRVIVTTGGFSGSIPSWIRETGHTLVNPLPSLFTFNLAKANRQITSLMGVSVPDADISIDDSGFSFSGPLLITHWGFSGPAVLKLSAFGARWLHKKNYLFSVSINWTNESAHVVLEKLRKEKNQHPGRSLKTAKFHGLPKRLWDFFLERNNLDPDLDLGNLPEKKMTLLAGTITSDRYQCSGKTTFKDEFVTCGGIDLREVDMRTMESKRLKGLFFAGEVLDIDGITGGFNFQAAWSTAYIAGSNVF